MGRCGGGLSLHCRIDGIKSSPPLPLATEGVREESDPDDEAEGDKGFHGRRSLAGGEASPTETAAPEGAAGSPQCLVIEA